MILQHIAPGPLASLALVNRDCLQWARSCRFVYVYLDYSPYSLRLLQQLLGEAAESLPSTHPTSSLSRLGLCIRRITVATVPYYVTKRHGVDLGEQFINFPKDKNAKRIINTSKAFYGTYISNIQLVLNPIVLSNLKLLDWQDKIALSESFFESLAVSPIQYLKLYRVALNQEFDMAAQFSPTTFTWPLRTLHLELNPLTRHYGQLNTSPLSASILRLCSPTLEDLKLRPMDANDYYSFHDSTIHAPPRFPNLRRLHIGRVGFKDSSMLKALVQNSLRYLEVGYEWTSVYREFFEKIGTISALSTFVWNGSSRDEPPCSFLHANSHIAKLALPCAISSLTLETKIIPLLEKKFQNLASLSMVWKENAIANSALQGICTLKTLKQLRLSAGNQWGWKHDWLIKHDTLRHYLSSLPLLENLAFSRDSYNFENPSMDGDSYYSYVYKLDAERAEDWEYRHRERMCDEANKYVRVMPQLEWIYLGQIPMSVQKGNLTGSEHVQVLFERDGCRTFMGKMFGGDID